MLSCNDTENCKYLDLEARQQPGFLVLNVNQNQNVVVFQIDDGERAGEAGLQVVTIYGVVARLDEYVLSVNYTFH